MPNSHFVLAMQVIFYYIIIVVVVVIIIIIFNIIIIIIILFGVNRINDRRSIDVFSCSNLFPYIYWFSFMFNTIFDKKYFPTTHSLKFQMLFFKQCKSRKCGFWWNTLSGINTASHLSDESISHMTSRFGSDITRHITLDDMRHYAAWNAQIWDETAEVH